MLMRTRLRPQAGRPQGAALHIIGILWCAILLVSCGSSQSAQPDPHLKLFHVLSSQIIMLDNHAEVDGMVQNRGTTRFPFDVSLVATFYDNAGNVIGSASGTAEDVWPSMTSPFVLQGQVESAKYSSMIVVPVSLRERRLEKHLPTPPPIVP